MSTISTHVLDTALGKPAQGIRVTLQRDGSLIGSSVTDQDAYLIRDSHAHYYGGVYLALALFLIYASTNVARFRQTLNVVFVIAGLTGTLLAYAP